MLLYLLLLAGMRPTKFHNNTSQNGGGHICIDDSASVRIVGAEFLDGGGPLIGGAVQLSKKSVVRMYRCSIKDCTAQVFGGGVAVFDDAQLKMSSSSITGCSSPGHGGGLYAMDRSKVGLSNATTIANCSATNGGGIFVDGAATLAMLESRVVNCSTQDGRKASAGTGGGILVSGNAELLINSSVVAGCSSPTDNGGGVAAWERSLVFVVNSSILDNRAGRSGGGLFARGPDVQVGLRSSNFTGNAAGGHGGGVYMNEGGLLYLRGTIHAIHNKALLSGGGMALEPAVVNISDGTQPGSDNLSAKSLFKAIAASNNTAKAYAPDISILSQKIQIVNSSGNLDGYVNSIDSKGGLLYITLNISGVSGLPSDEPVVWEALDGSAVQYGKRTTLISGIAPSQPGEVFRRIPISLRRPPGAIDQWPRPVHPCVSILVSGGLTAKMCVHLQDFLITPYVTSSACCTLVREGCFTALPHVLAACRQLHSAVFRGIFAPSDGRGTSAHRGLSTGVCHSLYKRWLHSVRPRLLQPRPYQQRVQQVCGEC